MYLEINIQQVEFNFIYAKGYKNRQFASSIFRLIWILSNKQSVKFESIVNDTKLYLYSRLTGKERSQCVHITPDLDGGPLSWKVRMNQIVKSLVCHIVTEQGEVEEVATSRHREGLGARNQLK